MGPFDIAVIVIISAAVAAVAGSIIYKKIKHKGGGCGCGCESCPHCKSCKKEEK